MTGMMKFEEVWPARRNPFAKRHKMPAYDDGVMTAIFEAYRGGLITYRERNLWLAMAGLLIEDAPYYGPPGLIRQFSAGLN